MIEMVPNVTLRYDCGTFYQGLQLRGGATISKMSTFQIFPNFGPMGGGGEGSGLDHLFVTYV